MSIKQFTNKYGIKKTLKFELKPVGQTLEKIKENRVIEADLKRNTNSKTVKLLIDKAHKNFIERKLNTGHVLDNDVLNQYYLFYKKSNKTSEDRKKLEAIEDKLRGEISDLFINDDEFHSLFGKTVFDEKLCNYAENNEQLDVITSFNGFTSAFQNHDLIRKNIYSKDKKAMTIGYRVVHQNLPRHIDNICVFEKLKNTGFIEYLNDFEITFNSFNIYDVFTIDFFNFILSQSGIDKYNTLIGGYTNENGVHVKGLNQIIQEYNHKHKDSKLPFLKPLYKQILGDSQSSSFVLDAFENDEDIFIALDETFNKDFFDAVENTSNLFVNPENFDLNQIYIKNDSSLKDVSNGAFGSWDVIPNKLDEQYDNESTSKNKTSETYYEKKRQYFKNIKYFPIGYLNQCLADDYTIINFIKEQVALKKNAVYNTHQLLVDYIKENYSGNIRSDKELKALIKDFLQAALDYKNFIKQFLYTEKEDKDELFYGCLELNYDLINPVTKVYNKVRNYVTKKPYSNKKFKLNFNSPTLFNGWDVNKETTSLGVMLVKDDGYYIGIMNKNYNKSFIDAPVAELGEPSYQKANFKYLPGANKTLPKVFFSKKGLEKFNPSSEILRIYKNGTFKKGENFDIEDCHKLIDFYKENIKKHDSLSQFDFEFSETSDYENIGEFFHEVDNMGYKVTFTDIPESYIDTLVNEGKLYLFKIHCRDLSKYAKGKSNLHTKYLHALFNESNIKETILKMDGGVEIFYRPASIKNKDMVIHEKNVPIKNKTKDRTKDTSVFDYDIIKDRRYTVDKFEIHIPFSFNFSSDRQECINDDVKLFLKNNGVHYIIGIDRGENNLITVTVIDIFGKIVEQRSLNIINGVNYNKILEFREQDNKKARNSFDSANSISEFKRGAISQQVHEIVKMIMKYENVVVALENLDSGFMRSRAKIEKQIYQEFENMLMEKLKYCVDKNKNPEELGGILNALQLVNKSMPTNKKSRPIQNGFVFFVPAWNTSQVDPVTGFVNLFNFRMKNISEYKEFFKFFDKFSYNKEKGYFEIKFNYDNFGNRTLNDYRKNWTICTHGERIEYFKNKVNKSNHRIVNLTEECIAILDEYSIDYLNEQDILPQILEHTEGPLFKELLRIVKLTVQLRNSKPGSSNSKDDYIVSPVANKFGDFYDSRNYIDVPNAKLPFDADTNGSFNIARKALWMINQIKNTKNDEDLRGVKLGISNKEWLEYIQKSDMEPMKNQVILLNTSLINKSVSNF